MRFRFCRPGRGLRGSKLAEHARKGPSRREGAGDTLWAVAATVARGDTEHDIGTGMVGGSASRQVRSTARRRKAPPTWAMSCN
jgi:hypothetical protein